MISEIQDLIMMNHEKIAVCDYNGNQKLALILVDVDDMVEKLERLEENMQKYSADSEIKYMGVSLVNRDKMIILNYSPYCYYIDVKDIFDIENQDNGWVFSILVAFESGFKMTFDVKCLIKAKENLSMEERIILQNSIKNSKDGK